MKEEDRDEFLAMVSHELRAPTTAILGWIELIEAGQGDGKSLAHGVKVIKRNARLQTKLIEQLLDFSRVGLGQLVLNPRHVSLASVLDASVETILQFARAKSTEVHSRIEFAEATIFGESERLQQIFINLLSNAVKFTPDSGHIEVRLTRVGASCAKVTVKDDGPGINADFLPCVFERFRRADTIRATDQEGLGLGLAITRKLVEMHRGTISAQSAGEGLGATFTVRLPLADRGLQIGVGKD